MLPKPVVKVIQAAAGYVVGAVAYKVLDKGANVIKNVVKNRNKEEAQQ